MPHHADRSELDARARTVLAAGGGIAHVSAFDAADITRRQLGLLHGRRVVERVRIGWFVDPGLPWQVKRAVGVGGAAACVTAAELWGLPVPPDSHRTLHVAVEEHRSHLRHSRDHRWVLGSVHDDEALELHWGHLEEEPIAGRASLVDTLLLLRDCVPFEWFVAALDAAVHEPRDGARILTDADRDRLSALLPRRSRAALEHVDGSAESCLETLLRLGMVRRGIGPVVAQAQLHPAHRVDFLIRGVLVVEADGEAFHDPERDGIRDAELRALGFVVLRFSYRAIVFDIERVLDEIEAVLAAL